MSDTLRVQIDISHISNELIGFMYKKKDYILQHYGIKLLFNNDSIEILTSEPGSRHLYQGAGGLSELLEIISNIKNASFDPSKHKEISIVFTNILSDFKESLSIVRHKDTTSIIDNESSRTLIYKTVE